MTERIEFMNENESKMDQSLSHLLSEPMYHKNMIKKQTLEKE